LNAIEAQQKSKQTHLVIFSSHVMKADMDVHGREW